MTISSGLSATNHTAHLVASQMPDFPITIVDTKNVGIAAGLVVMGAVRMVEEGVPYEELGYRLEALADETFGYFTVRELSYLHHGGRINEAIYRPKAEPRMEELVQKIRELIPNCIEVVKTELTPDLVVHAGPSLVGMVVQPLNAS